jgi:hypothetical protein
MGQAIKDMEPAATAARVAVQAVDLNVNTLSYYTDAGTEYTTGASTDTLKQTLAAADLPFRLIQLDDWSHATNASHPVDCGCLEKWTANLDFFPQGWNQLVNETGLPLALYLPGEYLYAPSAVISPDPYIH